MKAGICGKTHKNSVYSEIFEEQLLTYMNTHTVIDKLQL